MGSFVENVNKLAANMPVDGWASLDEKVDKVAGKGLSTEDYTSLEKQKLYGIAEGATSNAGDAFLTDRGNHTGTQSIDTITESASLKILTATERVKLDAVSVHPETHPVGIIYGLTNPSKFVKTDAVGNTGFSDVTWSDVQGKPSSFNPNVHQHSLSDLSDSALKADKTYVDTQLSAKADTSTLTIELAKKADLNIVATGAELQAVVETLQPLSQKGQANGYVPLDSGGKIPNSYLNNLSTIEVFTANSESNMLLLSNVSVGDQCIRTDLASNNLFILTQTPATELTNWKQINTSASVLSVNGQTGVVNVSKSDVGLGNVDNTADVSKTVLSATKLATARTISLASDVTGSASFDGSGNISITATIVDNSHSHTLANISDFPSSVSATELGYLDTVSSNIQTQLNAKQATLVSATNIKTINGNSIVGGGNLVVAGGDMLKTTYDTTNNGIVDKTENLVGGNNTTLLGSIPYQSNTDTTTLLAPNTTTTRKFLRQTGSGTNGSAPVWDTILASDVPTLNQNTTGNAATATKLTTSYIDWSTSGVIGNVVGMLAWKNYGNGHCIFDASAGSAPNGVAVNNTNPDFHWISTHPTLMGWDGSNTYGVRVDRARVADSATKLATARTINGVSFDGSANITVSDDTKQANLGFTPVQQGTGIGQSGNMVKIGWSGTRTKITIDATDMGNIVMDSNIGVANSSLVKTALNASGDAPIYACRAWVNFNGTGTVAIRASGNVSSITDNGVGDYTVNFATAMPDENYASASMSSNDTGTGTTSINKYISQLTTSIRVRVSVANNMYDAVQNTLAFFR